MLIKHREESFEMFINQHGSANLEINAVGSIFSPDDTNLIEGVGKKESIEGVDSDTECTKLLAYRGGGSIQSVRECMDVEWPKTIFPNSLKGRQKIMELTDVSRLHWKRTKVGIGILCHPIDDDHS